MTESEYKKIRREHDAAKESASEARGVLQSLTDRLKNEFKLPDVKAARKKLKTLAAEVKTLEADFQQKLETYQKEHSK